MTTKIAFTSCMDADDKNIPNQPVWADIVQAKPDILLLLGDQIYMDWGPHPAVPDAKKAYLKNSAKGKEAFATDMHRRYAAQWNLLEFRQAMAALKARGTTVHLVWDDHDFAWNSAFGQDDTGANADNDAVVPPELRNISEALFRQFAGVVKAGDANAAYPALPNLATIPSAKGLGTQTIPVPRIGGLNVLLLDERSFRQPSRPGGGTTILGEPALSALCEEVSRNDQGLLIVAGSSPLKHHYATTPKGWWMEPDANDPQQRMQTYADYGRLLAAAQTSQRPVLYLGGDIHRNSYGGPVEPDSSVVQVLSSGAARGHFLFVKFPPSWGLIEIKGGPKDCSIALELRQVGQLPAAPQRLAVAKGKWQDTPEGECFKAVSAPETLQNLERDVASIGPLRMALYREVAKKTPDGTFDLPWSELDQKFQDALPSGYKAPKTAPADGGNGLDPEPDRPITLTLARSTTPGMVQVTRDTYPSAATGATLADSMRAAFQQARTNQQPVVLFIPGFNKRFSVAALEALQMQQRFGVVPFLYSWPSGDADGFMDTVLDFKGAIERAEYGVKGLQVAVSWFADVAKEFSDVPAIVLARSTGAYALMQALGLGTADFWRERLKPITRVLLSSPMLEAKRHEEYFAELPVPVIVTTNVEDETLGYAQWVRNPVKAKNGEDFLLGHMHARDISPAARNGTYVDCTGVTGVYAMHDYWLPRLSPEMVKLNDHLMRDKTVNRASIAALGIAGLEVYGK